MKHLVKAIFTLIVLAQIASCGQNSDQGSSKSTSYEKFVIVKAVDPSDNKLKYGAFKLLSSPNSEGANLEWIFLSDGSRSMDFKSDSVLLGNTFAEEKSGILFKIYALSYSKKDKSSFWIESLAVEYSNEYSTAACESEFSTIGDLNGYDFSNCFKSI